LQPDPVIVPKLKPLPKPVPEGAHRSLDFWLPFVIWHLRRTLGISQLDMAERMDCERTYISKIERSTIPHAPSLPKIAAVLETNVYHILRMTEFLVMGA
jgi:DNA-binding XRE family transcriptional regulator